MGRAAGLATPGKPRANGLSEGRSGYLGGRRSAGRRRRRSAGRSAGRWRSPCEALDALRFQFQGSLNFGNPEVYILFDRPPWKNKWVKAEKRVKPFSEPFSEKFHSVTKSRQISTIARRNFVAKTRRDSPWQPATVAQVRVSIPSRNPEILTPIGAPPAIVFVEFLSQMAMPRGAVRHDKDGDLRQTFKASPFLMLSPTSLIFARPAKQWGVSFAPPRRFW